GRIGCFLSGDGDYGIPTSLPWGMSFPNGVVPTTERVHPTPLYEFAAWMLIAYVLWRIGARFLQEGNPSGRVFCAYLILTGMARFVAACVTALIPVLLALLGVRIFSYLGWMRAKNLALGVSSYYAVFLVIGVAVGLTVCLRLWGRRFRKESDSPNRQ